MAEAFELIQSRRSVRNYLVEDVPDSVVARILTAAIWAPSAGNVQPWYFYIVREDYLKKKMADAALGQNFLVRAPVVIVVCADLERARASYGKRGETLYCCRTPPRPHRTCCWRPTSLVWVLAGWVLFPRT